MTEPLISVIMSVYNGAEDAPKAIDSILDQAFDDFEFIIIDNGSERDDTAHVLKKIAQTKNDPRLKIHTLPQNIGLAGALNYGIAQARGKYIARQDHDDLSKPERFAAQIQYMEANPSCAILGTRAEIWRGDTPRGISHNHATGNLDLQFDLLFNNPFVHSSVFIRKDALDQVGVYTTDPTRQPPEDYELWSRIAQIYEVGNLAENYLIYREMPKSMSRDDNNPFLDRLITITAENIAHASKRDTHDIACRDAACLIHCAYDKLQAADIEDICNAIQTAAHNLEMRFGKNSLQARAETACNNLRHHFSHRHMPQNGAVISALGRLPLPQKIKNFGKALINKRMTIR
ncbi:MAG: glycosyltransferase [Pseudomonadota bacterium]